MSATNGKTQTPAPKSDDPSLDDKEPHKVDEKVQEEAARERQDNPGYD